MSIHMSRVDNKIFLNIMENNFNRSKIYKKSGFKKLK